MDWDNSWSALVNPGGANNFFDFIHPGNIRPTQEYNPVNSLWFMEFSRLVYLRELDQTGKETTGEKRNSLLELVGFRQAAFFANKESQCMIVEAKNDLGSNPIFIVVFRGTDRIPEWRLNINFRLVQWHRKNAKVHCGFEKGLRLIWKEVDSFLNNNKHDLLFFTGHSQGAAIASLAAAVRPPTALYTFGSPRVGNENFANSLSKLPIFRVVNCLDLVTQVPFKNSFGFSFKHIGETFYINREGVLKRVTDPYVSNDRNNKDKIGKKTFDHRISVWDPPKVLSDHSAVNYSTHLESQLSG
jgi:triacylglycerol lipase